MKIFWTSLTLLLMAATAVAQQSSVVYDADGNAMIANEYVVVFKSHEHAQDFYARQGRSLVRNLGTSAMATGLIKAQSPGQLNSMVAQITQDAASLDDIAYVEPNFLYTLSPHQDENDEYLNYYLQYAQPEDEFFDRLWGLNNLDNQGVDVNALKAWEVTRGHTAITIAVIDTGIDYTHPDLVDNIWVNPGEIAGNGIDDDNNGYIDDMYGYDFANDDNDPIDDNNHGTHCAGTIGASHNSIGVAGVMANVKLMALKFLTGRGSGSLADAVKAIDYATMMGVDVMSNSWGGGGRSQAMLDAILRAEAAGIVFVAAAGNSSQDNDRRPSYPANYGTDAANVISVAAMDIEGRRASFTSYGASTVHVAAPGVNILSTVKGGGYKSFSGTSMATPHVAGVIGLVMTANGGKFGDVNASNMREWLVQTSTPRSDLKDVSLSDGFVNAFTAVTGQLSIQF